MKIVPRFFKKKTDKNIVSQVDLTHILSEKTPVFPGKTPFKKVTCCFYENGYRLDDMNLSTGIGTHMDSPKHFYPNGLSATGFSLRNFKREAYILNISEKVRYNPDYAISADDIIEWESQYKKIPGGIWFLAYTGWSIFWETEKFCNVDIKGVCHFPGFAYSAAELLAERRVCGVGIDTMGIDVGESTTLIAHKILLEKNIFLLENLACLNQLPPVGSILYTFPMKVDASEVPVRVIAEFHNNTERFLLKKNKKSNIDGYQNFFSFQKNVGYRSNFVANNSFSPT